MLAPSSSAGMTTDSAHAAAVIVPAPRQGVSVDHRAGVHRRRSRRAGTRCPRGPRFRSEELTGTTLNRVHMAWRNGVFSQLVRVAPRKKVDFFTGFAIVALTVDARFP